MRLIPPNWCRSYDASMERRAEAARQRQRMGLFYRQFVQKGDLCFDVGANMGNRAAILLDLGARVICIEPQPDCIKRLRKRFGKNRNVVIVESALGEKEGDSELSVCEKEPTISTMSQRWQNLGRFAGKNGWGKTIPVKVTTLDRLTAQYGTPTFCKIDVEGFEVYVLKGLSKPIPVISFEFTREFFSDAKTCIDGLLSIGPAVFNATFGESTTLLWKRWVNPEELFGRLEAEDDTLLWGDIYAKFM